MPEYPKIIISKTDFYKLAQGDTKNVITQHPLEDMPPGASFADLIRLDADKNMNNAQIYKNIKKEIIKLATEKLKRQPTAEELQRLNKDRSLLGLESIIDTIKYGNLNKTELEKYLKEL